MKYFWIHYGLVIFLIFFSCSENNKSLVAPLNVSSENSDYLIVKPEINTQLNFDKVVFIGNSLTAGYQSGGLAEDLQIFSFPNQIADQLGIKDFQQPLIDGNPGIGNLPGVGILDFDPTTGAIFPRGTYSDPFSLLKNAALPRPYDNLGIPGAKLKDLLRTKDGSNGNPFFDIILRNNPPPGLGGTTQVEQLKLLQPTLVIVSAGNNDILGAATAGGDLSLITPENKFQQDFQQLMSEIKTIRGGDIGILVLDIPNVTDIPFINLLDKKIYVDLPEIGKIPVVFDKTFQPIDFNPDPKKTLYIPLVMAEGGWKNKNYSNRVKHVLLPFLSQYKKVGLGVPNLLQITDYLVQYAKLSPADAAIRAAEIIAVIGHQGLVTNGIPIPKTLTITEAETKQLVKTVKVYNHIIWKTALNQRPIIPVISLNLILKRLNDKGIKGFSSKFVFFDPVNTAFSLDGVHPNNAGYAIIANVIILVMNLLDHNANIPLINLECFRGQYVNQNISSLTSYY